MVRTPRENYPPPDAFVRNSSKWTSRWKTRKATKNWAPQIVKNLIKRSLMPMTHGKCAYCEGRLGSQSYCEIDHYIPKLVAPHKVFDWDNLFSACCVCNKTKGDRNHRHSLIKPDLDDPEMYLWINPNGLIEPHPNLDAFDKDRAVETIEVCGLNRGPLVSDRAEALLHNTDSEELLLKPAREFKLVIRQYRPELAAEDRRRFEARLP